MKKVFIPPREKGVFNLFSRAEEGWGTIFFCTRAWRGGGGGGGGNSKNNVQKEEIIIIIIFLIFFFYYYFFILVGWTGAM